MLSTDALFTAKENSCLESLWNVGTNRRMQTLTAQLTSAIIGAGRVLLFMVIAEMK